MKTAIGASLIMFAITAVWVGILGLNHAEKKKDDSAFIVPSIAIVIAIAWSIELAVIWGVYFMTI